MTESLQNIPLHRLPSFSAKDVPVDILRLDLLHPIVSGNKWFKLKYYIADALSLRSTRLVTFGGAWSNHIVATAFAAGEAGMESVGLVRGEPGTKPSLTLEQARELGMEIVYVSREDFRDHDSLRRRFDTPGSYWVAEGGYGRTGARGAAEILSVTDTSVYSHIFCAVGTGTMMAGLVNAALPAQTVTGVSVLKGNHGIEKAIRTLLADEDRGFSVLHDYHFGGYAKHPPELLRFMNETWEAERLPTDIVYTSKLLYAVKDRVARDHFPGGARILLVHSGGLQGNRSLPAGTLSF